MDKLHTCTQANPMRINSDPDEWQHPSAVLVGEPWWTFGNPDKAEEVECRYRECPWCEHTEQFRTGQVRAREIMP